MYDRETKYFVLFMLMFFVQVTRNIGMKILLRLSDLVRAVLVLTKGRID